MRDVIKSDRVRVEERVGDEAGERPAASAGRAKEADLRVTELDGGLCGVELTCSCGRTSVFEIEFEDEETSEESAT